MNDTTPDSTNIIGQRLKYEMKKSGISSTELAKHADVKTSFIYDIIRGKSTNPSSVKLARVVDVLGISLAYLVDVTGNAPVKTVGDFVSLPRLSVEMSGDKPSVITLPCEDESAIFRSSWITQHLHMKADYLRIMNVRGDSMEPTFYHNDLILVDTAQKAPSSPGFFVLFDGFGLVVKRLELISQNIMSHIRVVADNMQYSSYERPVSEISIVGRIVWFAREL
jgi:transcriptional regulator with XRE-family HTH domain